MSKYKIGQKVRINHLAFENTEYDGRTGIIKHIDDKGQLHGTWGGLAIQPEADDFEIIEDTEYEPEEQTGL